MQIVIDISLSPPTATLAAAGELDIFSARHVATSLRDSLALGCSRIVIDVAGVSFVDASALGVFARLHSDLAVEGGTMEFVATSREFRRLCSIVRLDDVFDLRATS